MPYDYDLLVIGYGPAGEKGAAKAAYFGKRVAVIEKEAAPGGAAVHTGTLPSKTLRETALFLSGHRQRKLYGLQVTLDPSMAVPKLLSRKDAVRTKEVDRIRWNLPTPGRPSKLQKQKFAEWKAKDSHPDRDNSTAHIAELFSRHFEVVDARAAGGLARFHRLVVGDRHDDAAAWLQQTEKKLPAGFHERIAAVHTVSATHPRSGRPASTD